MITSIINGHLEGVKTAVQKGANVNTCDPWGVSLIFFLIKKLIKLIILTSYINEFTFSYKYVIYDPCISELIGTIFSLKVIHLF